MKLTRYASDKDNPAIKGNLSAEDIVRADWERNYKKKGISLGQAKLGVKAHVDAGGAVFRMRNTLILVTPEDDFAEVKFHTITADPAEVYQSLMLMFFLGLAQSKGTQTAFTYVNDRSAYRMAKRIVGESFVDIDESDDPKVGKYVLTLDLAGLIRFAQAKQAQQAARGGV